MKDVVRFLAGLCCVRFSFGGNPVAQAQTNQQNNQAQAEGYLSSSLANAIAAMKGMPAAPSASWGPLAPPPATAGAGTTMGGGTTTGLADMLGGGRKK